MSYVTIQYWGTGHRVTTEKEIENDSNRKEEGQGESGTKILNSRTLCIERISRLSSLANSGGVEILVILRVAVQYPAEAASGGGSAAQLLQGGLLLINLLLVKVLSCDLMQEHSYLELYNAWKTTS